MHFHHILYSALSSNCEAQLVESLAPFVPRLTLMCFERSVPQKSYHWHEAGTQFSWHQHKHRDIDDRTYGFVKTFVVRHKLFVLFPGGNEIIRDGMENLPVYLSLQGVVSTTCCYLK